MAINYRTKLYQINCLASDLESLYHQAAQKLGLSDSVLFLLYLLYEKGGSRLLNDIRKDSNISKQTLNSAIRKLEAEGIVSLTQSGSRAKTVSLTEKGTDYANHTVARLCKAECNVFRGWTEEEINLYLRLMEKYNNDFRKQLEIL